MLVKDKDILVEDPEKKDGDNAEKSPAPQNAAQGTKSNKHYRKIPAVSRKGIAPGVLGIRRSGRNYVDTALFCRRICGDAASAVLLCPGDAAADSGGYGKAPA